MSNRMLDAEAILRINDQWTELEEKWGIPVDLETDEDYSPSKLRPIFSSLDLRRTTFDSSFLFKKVSKKVNRQLSKSSKIVDYKDFIQDLEKVAVKDVSNKQFYYINGEIMSFMSIEDICSKIDEVFKSIEKLCSATSTLRRRKLPDVINCSISTGDLSFDNTVEEEKHDSDDVNIFIDEAFQQLSDTIATYSELNADETPNSVTTLVRRFSSILKSPVVVNSPKRKRECCERFKELAEFWSGRAFEN